MSLPQYVARVSSYVGLTRGALASALAYVDRAVGRGGVAVTPATAHRVFLAAAVAAQKFWFDERLAYAYLAHVGGVPAAELKSLEGAFLAAVGFDLWVEPLQLLLYDLAVAKVEVMMLTQAQQQGVQVGARVPLQQQQQGVAAAAEGAVANTPATTAAPSRRNQTAGPSNP
eukprot:TRINITY_DN6428_c0_g1_i1.p2 TRINITY_DN6428_c0_g1~~TRINITY_DN6428_c0_g1_i1.p2  ORF type:complete len:189 (+),score=77.69 TRINITY_DN6428_c0_g1_i1:56-568(+)